MLRSERVSAAKMKGLYTSWVSWNTLPGAEGSHKSPTPGHTHQSPEWLAGDK